MLFYVVTAHVTIGAPIILLRHSGVIFYPVITLLQEKVMHAVFCTKNASRNFNLINISLVMHEFCSLSIFEINPKTGSYRLQTHRPALIGNFS